MDEATVGGVVLAISAAGSGALVHAVTRSAASGVLARNGLVGIRTRRTTSSDVAWRAGHTGALPWTRRTAWVTAALGALTLATIPVGPVATYAAGTTAIAVLLAGSLLAVRAAHRAILDGD